MSRNPLNALLYRQASLLSQMVAEDDPFFKEIALMGVEERIQFATLWTIEKEKILDKDLTKMSVYEIISEILLPILQRKGQARFKADPLTHLGWKTGKPSDEVKHEL